MMVSPSSMQSRTSAGSPPRCPASAPRTDSSTRQSVASVTCATRENASKRMLSARVCLRSRRRACLRICAEFVRIGARTAAPPRRAARSNSPTLASRTCVDGVAALLHLAQAMMQRRDQLPPALRIVEQIVLQVGVAVAPPRCRRAPRTACAPNGRCGARRADRPARPRRLRPADGSRSRGRPARCSCREFRANRGCGSRARRPNLLTAFMARRFYALFSAGCATRSRCRPRSLFRTMPYTMTSLTMNSADALE